MLMTGHSDLLSEDNPRHPVPPPPSSSRPFNNDPPLSASAPAYPILITRSSSGHSTSIHPQKQSLDATSNALKINTNVVQHDRSIPVSPIPSSTTAATDETHLMNNIDDFVIKCPIGYGSSAIVYSAIYKPTNQRVALKMIDLDMFERNQIDELRRETALMALSRHPNVLRVLGSFVDGSKLYIVTPYLAGGSCLDIIKTQFRDGLDESSIATILKQALEGLAYLHRNGHIHRDVKAGNLLMDHDGAVLLGDFGVSGSLSDYGERGVRKTFVGTPCWMAPEVMEQTAYDYKADIWSFGITSIELATGHAPFAKLPPLKVLMMTLSSDPPTLVRETAKHKYSRTFKDMIDLCLNKDPSKRPSAEKLLQHPFFKQARRRDHLVRALLNDLPPLENRPRKKVPQRYLSINKTEEEWDFQEQPSSNDENDPSSSNELGSDSRVQQQQVKRHISFGDVVVKNPPQPYTGTNGGEQQVAPETQSKKSRFTVDQSTTTTTPVTPPSQDSPILHPKDTTSIQQQNDDPSMRKTRFSINHQLVKQASEQYSPSSSIESTLSERHDHQHGCSDRKSRFEVHHGDDTTTSSSSPQLPPSSICPAPMPNSNYALCRHSSQPTSSGYALARESSSSRKVGRFELTTTDSNSHGGGGCDTTTTHYLPHSGASSNSSSVSRGQTFKSDPDSQASMHAHVEELLRANDTQRHALEELGSMLGFPMRTKSGVPRKPALLHHSSSSSSEGQERRRRSADEIMLTMESLENQLQASLRENQALKRENENLKREIDHLRGST